MRSRSELVSRFKPSQAFDGEDDDAAFNFGGLSKGGQPHSGTESWHHLWWNDTAAFQITY